MRYCVPALGLAELHDPLGTTTESPELAQVMVNCAVLPDPRIAVTVAKIVTCSPTMPKYIPAMPVQGYALARIIHIFEDNKSLLCYKHVV